MEPVKNKMVGYAALRQRYNLGSPPYYRYTSVAVTHVRRSQIRPMADGDWHILPPSYEPNGIHFLAAHLDFALRQEGVDLSTLSSLFRQPGIAGEMETYVRSKPTGQYARRAWFLYEFLTGERLDLPNASQGPYVDLLDPEHYVTCAPINSTRHRIRDNLLGNADFCPLVRRTPELTEWVNKALNERANAVIAEFDPDVLARAARYFYMKETRSSYEIERDRPDQRRMLRFVDALQEAHRHPSLDKALLVETQQTIVDERYAEDDYRVTQNYVGTTAVSGRETVHHVGAREGDVPRLMDGLFRCHERMSASSVDPVVEAAVIAFGFVYIHPFNDGNGRLHRFLIHQVLSSRRYTPDDLIFPVSAAMLAAHREYDEALESVSRPRLGLINYRLNSDGTLTVEGETFDLYRCWDATRVCEYLYRIIERTIEHDLVEELRFLVGYDEAKRNMQAIVDMPDRKIDLFIRSVKENGGRLSASKRKSHFQELKDDEVMQLERTVVEALERM